MKLLALIAIAVAAALFAKHAEPTGTWAGAFGIGFGFMGAVSWPGMVRRTWSGDFSVAPLFEYYEGKDGPWRAHAMARATIPGGWFGIHFWIFGCWLYFDFDVPHDAARAFLASAALSFLLWASVILFGRPRILMPLRYRRTHETIDEMVTDLGERYE